MIEKEEFGQFINNKWTQNQKNQKNIRTTFHTINPTTGKPIATFGKGTKEDVYKAIEAAEKAFDSWKRVPAPKRGEIILKTAHIMKERKQELGKLVTKETGKIISEGLGDVQEAIDFLEYIAGEGRRLFGETTPSELPNKFCLTIRQPLGVVSCITPWNFPFAIPCWKIGAALISGNTILFKPSSLTPLCATYLVNIFVEAGLPKGVLNMIIGDGEEIGPIIIKDSRIKAISFTGGEDTGIKVYSSAAKQLKKVSLELGGHAPLIVLNDADVDLAINVIVFSAFGTSGQRCTTTRRLIVEKEIYDTELRQKLIERMKKFRVGDPLDPSTEMGPVISNSHLMYLLTEIKKAEKEGAKIIFGGKEIKGVGSYLQPTLLEIEKEKISSTSITTNEVFGPILSIIKVESLEEAIKIANSTRYGLASGIITHDINSVMKVIEELEFGIVYINSGTIGAEVHLPFGGIKSTGIGREAGTEAIREFTELKTIFIDYSRRLQKAQIVES